MTRQVSAELPIPDFYDSGSVDKIWRVPYEQRSRDARKWARRYDLQPAGHDSLRICLLLVDVQNCFCLPEFELFVAGRSGHGAVDDNKHLCEFIYRNMANITQICPTMDSHQALQIFHSIFLINKNGEHPNPFTQITREDVQSGKWRFNPDIAHDLSLSVQDGQRYLEHYVEKLFAGGKYELTIWPYHAMLGGIGHALVASIEEAVFFHSVARYSQPNIQLKGHYTLTENYSVLCPEVLTDPDGRPIADRNTALIEKLLVFDAIIVAGQAKSHCVAWTLEDLLSEIRKRDARLARKVYLLEDGSSPVVLPGVIDYSDVADRAYNKFAEAGMHLVKTTDQLADWPEITV